jgi:hypothetical protein
MKTFEELLKACNACANFFADTEGVEYYVPSEWSYKELLAEYKEYRSDEQSFFPELAKFL